MGDKQLQLVAKDARTAQLSPNGQLAAYERGGNLYVYDLAKKKEQQLTKDAQTNFYNGRFGWVYEEEFGLVQAWDWSPDSRYIAFWQTDERQIPIYQMTDFTGSHAEYSKIPLSPRGRSRARPCASASST
ncbi:MAG: DPP IV N-terminal domain-containing protein [Saprospiraceae bacterium]|nr:DPP IV N-terminal domain-containing protein [Saprospiraceae bacterium]